MRGPGGHRGPGGPGGHRGPDRPMGPMGGHRMSPPHRHRPYGYGGYGRGCMGCCSMYLIGILAVAVLLCSIIF